VTDGVYFGDAQFGMRVLGLKQLDAGIRTLAKFVPGGDVADALEEGAWEFVIKAVQNAHAQGLYKKGDLVKAIKPKKINQFVVDLIVDIVYGAVHEFGLEQQVITDRQRRFFWAMYADTGEDMWKALALSTTYTIPMRSYFRPAVRDGTTQRRAALVAGQALAAKVAQRVRQAA
jgi:hypothetical protein